MKEIFRIFLVVFLEVFFLSFPFWAKFITDNPLIFPPEDEPLDWLMFGATYYGVAASFLMIFYTSLSLKQNRKQLDEMKRQWKEDHKPEIIAYLVGHEGFLHLCVKNISAARERRSDIAVEYSIPEASCSRKALPDASGSFRNKKIISTEIYMVAISR